MRFPKHRKWKNVELISYLELAQQQAIELGTLVEQVKGEGLEVVTALDSGVKRFTRCTSC